MVRCGSPAGRWIQESGWAAEHPVDERVAVEHDDDDGDQEGGRHRQEDRRDDRVRSPDVVAKPDLPRGALSYSASTWRTLSAIHANSRASSSVHPAPRNQARTSSRSGASPASCRRMNTPTASGTWRGRRPGGLHASTQMVLKARNACSCAGVTTAAPSLVSDHRHPGRAGVRQPSRRIRLSCPGRPVPVPTHPRYPNPWPTVGTAVRRDMPPGLPPRRRAEVERLMDEDRRAAQAPVGVGAHPVQAAEDLRHRWVGHQRRSVVGTEGRVVSADAGPVLGSRRVGLSEGGRRRAGATERVGGVPARAIVHDRRGR